MSVSAAGDLNQKLTNLAAWLTLPVTKEVIAMFFRLAFLLSIVTLSATAWAQSPLDGLTEADLAEGEKLFRVH